MLASLAYLSILFCAALSAAAPGLTAVLSMYVSVWVSTTVTSQAMGFPKLFCSFSMHCVEFDNHVEKFMQETDNSVEEKVDVREKHAELKKVFQDLKQSYSSLKQMTEAQMRQPQQFQFTDTRVTELWTLAQQANMTEDELASLKASLPVVMKLFYVKLG